MASARRWRKGLLVVLGVLALAVLGAWLFLTSDAGGALVKARVLSAVNASIEGRVEAQGLSLAGGQVVLTGVKLFTPEGELVAEIDRVEADVALAQLASGNVEVKRARLVSPHVFLVDDERGLNIVRAVAAKVPSAPGGAPAKFQVALDQVSLEQGTLRYQAGERLVALEQLALQGDALLRGPPFTASGEVDLTGRLKEPLEAPLELHLTSRDGAAALTLALGEAKARTRYAFASQTLTLEALTVPPELVRAFAPDVKLLVPLTLEGTLSPAAVELTARGGAATVKVGAGLAGEGPRHFSIALQHLDLSELLEGALASNLDGALEGELADPRPASLTGFVKGSLQWNDRRGGQLAQAQVDVRAEDGALRAAPLKVELPGAYFTLRGTGSPKALGLSGRLVAEDLAATSRALGSLLGRPPPPLAGEGVLSLSLTGPLLHPSLTARGTFVDFRAGSVSLTGLNLDLTAPDVTRPLVLQGALDARRLALGEQHFDQLAVRVDSEGRALRLGVSTAGLTGFALHALGTFAPQLDALSLSELGLDTPEGPWTLEAPTTVSWGEALSVTPLTLRSGSQRLGLSFSSRRGQVDGSAQLDAVELAHLPALLVPRSLDLAGTVDGKVHLAGRWPKVSGDVELRWKDGRVLGVAPVGAEVSAHAEAGALQGTVTARSPFASGKGSLTAPLEAFSPGATEAVHAELALSQLSLGPLQTALHRPLPLEGDLTATLRLDGPVRALEPQLELQSPALAFATPAQGEAPARRVELQGVTLSVKPGEGGALTADLAASTLGGTVAARLQSGVSLTQARALLAAEPLAWRRQPFDASLSLRGVDLATLAPAGLGPPLVGHADVEVLGHGPVEAPTFETQSAVRGLELEGLLPLDGKLAFASTRNDTTAALDVARGERTLASLKGRVSSPFDELLAQGAAQDRPLVLEASVGPLTLAEVLKVEERSEAPPAGTVSASLSVEGTPSNPTLALRGALKGLAVGKLPLGNVALSYDYAKAKHALSAVLTSQGGGTLDLSAQLALDASLPAVRKGLDWRRAPLTASLRSRDFDLGFLSGVTPQVRTLGGRLTASLDAKGPAATPDVEGTLRWTKGRLGLSGFGEYRELEVALAVTPQQATLSTFTGRAGGGTFNFHGELLRQSNGTATVSLAGATKSFPVITDDQLLALASLRTEVRGTLESALWAFQVALPEAHVELPEVARKDLQDLKPHPDVVLLRLGVPVRRKPRAADAPAPTRTIRVEVDAPRNLWVKSTDLNLELGLSEAFQVELTDQTRVSGEAFVKKGRIDVIGRRFDVDDSSSVRFQGPPTSPYLNVTAVHVNEREGVTVFVTVVGKGKDFSLKTSSQPPLPDSEIYTLLATGRRTLKRGSGASITPEQAASVVGSLAASQFKKVIAQRLPLDVLSIETGTEGLQRARVEAGTYLTDQLYLGYTLQVGADPRRGENTHSGKLEYQISRRWSFEAFAGDARALGADLVWTREY
ncbi:MAG: translocation/assembly module TamB [Myxococcaceae bacterium]|nr:translocation/assembly module TamB [Myxococcaceae bacterium]